MKMSRLERSYMDALSRSRLSRTHSVENLFRDLPKTRAMHVLAAARRLRAWREKGVCP